MDLAKIVFIACLLQVISAFAVDEKYAVKDNAGKLMCSWHQTSSKNECNEAYLKTSLQYQDMMEDNVNSSKIVVSENYKEKLLARSGKSEDQLKQILKAYCEYSLVNYEDKSLLSQAQLREFVQLNAGKYNLANAFFKLCETEKAGDEDSSCRQVPNTLPLPDWTSQSMDEGVWQKAYFWPERQTKSDIKDVWEKRLNKSIEVPDCSSINLEVYYKWACVAQHGLPPCFESEASSGFFNFFGGGSR
ncbi:MAG: hypothetical protein VX642_07480 [Bdellovibrionota bacterium]|nr:hypothetical protein [Bdellovibrionota bacterium]